MDNGKLESTEASEAEKKGRKKILQAIEFCKKASEAFQENGHKTTAPKRDAGRNIPETDPAVLIQWAVTTLEKMDPGRYSEFSNEIVDGNLRVAFGVDYLEVFEQKPVADNGSSGPAEDRGKYVEISIIDDPDHPQFGGYQVTHQYAYFGKESGVPAGGARIEYFSQSSK